MAIEQFADGIEPDNPHAVIWRFMELWKLRDLLDSGQLYFRRSDKLEDADEGVPSKEFARQALGLNPYDINDIQKLNHDLGSTTQFRQAFYINWWYLFDRETAAMWAKYGRDGVAVVSRYSLLKTRQPGPSQAGLRPAGNPARRSEAADCPLHADHRNRGHTECRRRHARGSGNSDEGSRTCGAG